MREIQNVFDDNDYKIRTMMSAFNYILVSVSDFLKSESSVVFYNNFFMCYLHVGKYFS